MSFQFAWLARLASLATMAVGLLGMPAQAQNAPDIYNFTVEQVAQVTPGTELIFRVNGTAGGTLTLRLDGVENLIGLPETRPGAYEGAYTVSIRDKIRFDSKVQATLRVGQRQTSTTLAQPLLTADAQAQALSANVPALAISRIETRNSGAFSGGHEINFTLTGTPGAQASVSVDGGKTSIPLVEDKSGTYAGSYTVKSRDRLSGATQVSATLAMGDRKTTVTKPLAAGVFLPQASAAVACDMCGVVQSVSTVKIKGKPNYVGAIAGGVAGAALGNQVGKGDGNTAATVLGALGGAMAGREVEKRVRTNTAYDVSVKMSNGSLRTIRFDEAPAFKVGSKVRVSGDTLVAND